jgi:hypothetical protein
LHLRKLLRHGLTQLLVSPAEVLHLREQGRFRKEQLRPDGRVPCGLGHVELTVQFLELGVKSSDGASLNSLGRDVLLVLSDHLLKPQNLRLVQCDFGVEVL